MAGGETGCMQQELVLHPSICRSLAASGCLSLDSPFKNRSPLPDDGNGGGGGNGDGDGNGGGRGDGAIAEIDQDGASDD